MQTLNVQIHSMVAFRPRLNVACDNMSNHLYVATAGDVVATPLLENDILQHWQLPDNPMPMTVPLDILTLSRHH